MTSASCPAAFPIDRMPFSFFDHGFLPWDFPDNFFATSSKYSPNSGSGSGDPNQDGDSLNSNSTVSTDHPSSPVAAAVVDERKRRRMLSNRDSARRSRMRKQKNLENLRNQVSRLKLENREITNRLNLFLYHGQHLRFENDQLRSDNLKLRQKLTDVCHVLLLRQQLNQQHQQQKPQQQQELIAPAAWTCVDNDDCASNRPSENNPTSIAD